ncbi:hypothetical protein PRIPAC_83380 [Pristionchus pacificus]|uniref:Uncharacterized protein n=1 Tax=Pristionchus pacificus TaxID=54126 RepID=A0A2A6BN38_PRIPA|nr:hypothetical protein PRIPAC_83380 [Pristionchus pacificus]|eukprot:PDM67327.1 hypothetical protein PRIPAC_48744 [Pristionchus pacificus]
MVASVATQVTETGYAGFTIPLSIWLAGKCYRVQYDLNLTMEQTAVYNTTTTISIGEYTPQFYSIAKRFGAEKLKRAREQLGIPGLDGGGGSIPSLSPAPPPDKIRKKDRVILRRVRSQQSRRADREAEDEDGGEGQGDDVAWLRPRAFLSHAIAFDCGETEEGREEEDILALLWDLDPSASPLTSSAMERLKKEEKKRDKDHPVGSSPSTTSEKMKQLERKLKEGAMDRKKEKEREKDKEKFAMSLSSLEKKEKERKEKDLLDRLPTLSQSERKEKERKEKRKEDDDGRPSSAAGAMNGVEREKKKERERERDKEKDLPSLTPSESSSAYKREKEKEKERKKKDKDRDRPPKEVSSSLLPSSSSSTATSSIPSLLSISVKRDKEAEKRNPPSITPPPVLIRQECAPSTAGLSSRGRGSASPPTLMPMANGRSSDYSSSRPSYGTGSGTVASQSTSSASALPSLQQPSPCSSIGGDQFGRETPSEKASGRSSISPGLRNEETASSGGSSASSHSSDRREQKRIPKLAPSQREREAMSAPLSSIDAASVRRRIDSLTDDDKIFDIALLLIDLDDTSYVNQSSSGPSLTYDLSKLDQKDLLRLDSVLSGS